LVHRDEPHDGKAYAHQTTCNQYHPGKTGVELSEIPGADISSDAQEWQEHDHALQPHGPYPGVAENKAHDEEYKSHAKQVDMRNTHQGVQGFAGILGNDGQYVVAEVRTSMYIQLPSFIE